MDVTNIEYRKGIEQNLAYDIWFMNTHLEDEYDEDFSWDKNCFPMEWGNGWCYPWYVTCTKLLTEVKSDFHIEQLKEKWGYANVYYSGGITQYGQQLIEQFEEESKEICENCGKPGKIYYDGWAKCLCSECYKQCR